MFRPAASVVGRVCPANMLMSSCATQIWASGTSRRACQTSATSEFVDVEVVEIDLSEHQESTPTQSFHTPLEMVEGESIVYRSYRPASHPKEEDPVPHPHEDPHLTPAFPMEDIHPDMVQLEIDGDDASGSGSGSSNVFGGSSSGNSGAAASSSPTGIGGHYEDVTVVDNFSRGRVMNYIQRHSTPQEKGTSPVTMKRESLYIHLALDPAYAKNPMAGLEVCRARITVPLPPPHSSYVAEGVSTTEKDAECLAAMHAERVIDVHGVQMYRLPSMQTKHAEAARKAGRYAPLPDDPVRSESDVGGNVPPPMRMLSVETMAAIATLTGKGGGGAADDEGSDFVFGGSVYVAEVVTPVSEKADEPPANLTPTTPTSSTAAPATTTTLSTSQGQSIVSPPMGTFPADTLHKLFHFPWRDGVSIDEAVDPDATEEQLENKEEGRKLLIAKAQASKMGFGNIASSTAATKFDPTENGTYQVTNITSSRCSSSADSISLGAILDKEAGGRIKEWLQDTQGVFETKSRATFSQVAVAGYASRMFQCELVLIPETAPGGGLVAKGKAVEADMALSLACMHAEMLIDATGRMLFPTKPDRQNKHAADVSGYGRYATQHVAIPAGTPLQSIVGNPPSDLPPLPCKQQLGSEELYLDLSQSKGLRTPDERIIAAHNEINITVYDFVEVNPEAHLLEEAKELMQKWQRYIAKSRYEEMYVCTKMGDFVRASCVLPVPPQYGTRGGNAVGRTCEQAIGLCALHCIDVLNTINIPVCRDPKEQEELMRRRALQGLSTPATYGTLTMDDHLCTSGQRIFVPYCPGYLIEGDKAKPMPGAGDLQHIQQLVKKHHHEGTFQLPVHQPTEKDILEMGNDTRLNLNMYTRRTVGKELTPSVYITGFSKGSTVFNVAFMPIMVDCHLLRLALDKLAGKDVGGDALPPSKPLNSADELQLQRDYSFPTPLALKHVDLDNHRSFDPAATEGLPISGHVRILAVGASLKKSDAIRCCFLHAAEILRSVGIDHGQEKHKFVAYKKANKQPPTNAPNTPPSSQLFGSAKGNSTINMKVSGNVVGTGRLRPVNPAAAALMAARKKREEAAPLPPPREPRLVRVDTSKPAVGVTEFAPSASSPASAPISTPSTTSSVSQSATATTGSSLPPTEAFIASLPAPFMHPTMRTFFANAKIEKAAQKRQQNRNSFNL